MNEKGARSRLTPQAAKVTVDLLLVRNPVKTRALFPLLVLKLLKSKSDHGYGLLDRMETLCGEYLHVSSNQIYPLLQQLEEQGFVTGEWDHPTKRTRRNYSLTLQGTHQLRKLHREVLPYLAALELAICALRAELGEVG